MQSAALSEFRRDHAGVGARLVRWNPGSSCFPTGPHTLKLLLRFSPFPGWVVRCRRGGRRRLGAAGRELHSRRWSVQSTVSYGVAHGPVADVPCFDVGAVGLAGETAWETATEGSADGGKCARIPSPIGPSRQGPVVPGVSPGRGGYPSGSHLQCTPAGGRFSLGGGSAGRCRFTPGRRRGPDAPTSVGRVPRVEAFPGLVRQRLAVVGMSVVRPVASGAGLHQS